MEFYVGTSGWFYPWNEEENLDWCMANSGLNAVELNASLYIFFNNNHLMLVNSRRMLSTLKGAR